MRHLLLGLMLAFAADIPLLTGRVVDEANTISAAARERLTAALKAHEDATTNQIVVLTVPTIGRQSVEEYAVKAVEAWKLGQKDKDNGILVVVVPQDRKMRIEVGYGLEGVLPDGATGEIIRTWMTPAFGIMTPGVGWFLYVFLIPFWAIFPLFVLSVRPTLVLLAAHIIGFPILKQRLKRSPRYTQAMSDLKTKGKATIGGFTWTTGGSSSSSDSGSRFSGGGGSSGGGGASGSW